LPRDKFLQEQVKLEDGWIPLEVMLKFKRLSNLTTDFDVIAAALEASELVQVRTYHIFICIRFPKTKAVFLERCICLVTEKNPGIARYNALLIALFYCSALA
jgi:hypothetical protein